MKFRCREKAKTKALEAIQLFLKLSDSTRVPGNNNKHPISVSRDQDNNKCKFEMIQSFV